MIPSRPTVRPSTTTDEAFHRSLRSTATISIDQATGRRSQVLTTTRLTMQWVGSELRMEFAGWRVRSDGEQLAARPFRPGRTL